MTVVEAIRLLDIPPGHTPEQLESRFLELRARLEEKIAKAPTPGLQAKYRASLADITEAFETLTLAADGDSLPVLERAVPSVGRVVPNALSGTTAPASKSSPRAAKTPAKAKSNREFLLVALIAVIVLGAGGWWIVKTRAENAERARQAEVAKSEAERLAAEQKQREADEKVQSGSEFARLRATQAELKIRWETIEREAGVAERRLSELKGEMRSSDGLSSPEKAELKARLDAQTDFVDWLQPTLARHPARTLLARFDALLSSKAINEASVTAVELTSAILAAETEITTHGADLLSLGKAITFNSEPTGLSVELRDSYGRTRRGQTPLTLHLPWGALDIKVQPRDAGWDSIVSAININRRSASDLSFSFQAGAITLLSDPPGLKYILANNHGFRSSGVTPAQISSVPVGKLTYTVSAPGPEWPDLKREVEFDPAQSSELKAVFGFGRLQLETTPPGAKVYLRGRLLGETPLSDVKLPSGRHDVTLRRFGYKTENLPIEISPGEADVKTVALSPSSKAMVGEWWENSLGMRFVPVDGTDVLFGVWEVRNQDYTAYLASLGRVFDSKERTFPAEGISWQEAKDFCAWLTRKERGEGLLGSDQSYRLPTDAEWSMAVGLSESKTGTPRSKDGIEKNTFPWGQSWPPAANVGNYSPALNVDSYPRSSPVGSFPANRFGIHDLGGNLWEWCEDRYDISEGEKRVLRGASHSRYSREYLLSSYRSFESPLVKDALVGFRCVLDLGKK